MRYNEGERIAVVDDRSFGSEDHAIIAELRSLLNARSETESKKALEPISVLTVAITIVAAKLVDGFVGQIGGDVWGAAKDKMKVLFRRKRNSPAHLLIVAATIDEDGDRRPVEVIRSDASDQYFDALRGEIIDETMQAAAVAVKSSPYLIGLSSHIREETAFGHASLSLPMVPILV